MSDLEFCGTICLAAKGLGIGLRSSSDSFEFYDPMSGRLIKGHGSEDKKVALKSACEELVKQISP